METKATLTRLDLHLSDTRLSRGLRLVGLLLLYGLCFTALRTVAVDWRTGGLFSLWFPAAGLRFAFLWHFGPRYTVPAAISELLVQLALGQNSLEPQPVLAVLGIVGPCLVYGGVIHLIRSRVKSQGSTIGIAPLPSTLSAILAPIAACIAAMPWALPLALESGPLDSTILVRSLLVFSLGDLLGVLLVAPPLLYMLRRVRFPQLGGRIKAPSKAIVAEIMLAMALAYFSVWVIYKANLGLLLSPVLLGTCWAGLRAGRPAAWLCFATTTLIVLPLTDAEASEIERLRYHMLLASIAAIGLLAGSFAEAQARARQELRRRDRLLFRAERLKTLRAMSLAVIHEISQPLSVIALDADELAKSGDLGGQPTRLRKTAQTISAKAQDLSHLVRRLRNFGEPPSEAPAPVPVRKLIDEVNVLAAPEAKARRVTIKADADCPDQVMGHEVELRQTLMNLVRNAIAASPPGGDIVLGCNRKSGRVSIFVENKKSPDRRKQKGGMGIGLIISRSIAELHGGSINEERRSPDQVRYNLTLPVHESGRDD